jgi:protein phosphatase
MVSATRVQLTYGASTDTGLKRSHNEDRFYADRETGLFVVVDGVGGQTAGQVAAETVVEEMRRFISDTKADEDKTWPFGMEPELSASIKTRS